MFRFDAQMGYYLYPEAGNSEDLKIPVDATDYAGFVTMMKVSEQEFMSAFF